MRAGVPLTKITWVTVVLIGLFLAAGVVLSITGNTSEAHGAIGTATGIAIGSGTSVAVTLNNNKGKTVVPVETLTEEQKKL